MYVTFELNGSVELTFMSETNYGIHVSEGASYLFGGGGRNLHPLLKIKQIVSSPP